MTSNTNRIQIWQDADRLAMGDPTIIQDIKENQSLNPCNTTAENFLKQLAFVIYGQRRNRDVVRKLMPKLEEAFFGWDSGRIAQQGETSIEEASKVYGDRTKAKAVKSNADFIHSKGWDLIQDEILGRIKWNAGGEAHCTQELICYLDEFPWIGPTSARSVAKNIGIQSIGDTLFMKRLAVYLGFTNDFSGVMEMAQAFQEISGQPLSIIDTKISFYAREQNWLGPATA